VPSDPNHAVSRRLLARIDQRDVPIVQPTLATAEIAGALARQLQDSRTASNLAIALGRARNVTQQVLDRALAEAAADLAAQYRLRGADAVYVAVALRFGSRLVTLDVEQRTRARSLVDTLTRPKRSPTPPSPRACPTDAGSRC